MKATDHLKSYGVTPRLKPGGKIGLQGVGSLPEHVKTEVITWAKDNREAILKELNPDQKGQEVQKALDLPPTKKRRRRKNPLITPAMVKAWRVGRAWILDHLPELQQAGWTRGELMRAGRFKYPCGTWGAAWGDVWLKPGATPALEPDGAITWTWADVNGKGIKQAMRPKNPNQRKAEAMTQDEWSPFIITDPLEIHPIGEIMPWMTGPEMEGLKASIQKHGLIDPIVLFQGKILDGKNRYKACQETGAIAWARKWEGGMDPVEYITSANLHRQQLSLKQAGSVREAAQTL